LRNLKVEGLVTFCYYTDLEKASQFYREVMGFELVFATDFAKIYKLKDNAFIGLVKRGRSVIPSLNILDEKAIKKLVMLSIMVSDVESWYQHLIENGIKTDHEPQKNQEIGFTSFRAWDPEGYVMEISDLNKFL
jgi:catechol 2,3-dioxygenase-like lactoylglutathione lyase family enzyme